MTKACTGCGETRPVDDFHRHPSAALGRSNRCKWCVRAYGIANRDVIRRRRRKRERLATYGLSDEQYQAFLVAQGGRCAVCGADGCNARKTVLCVDHDHETGRVRGLLCDSCNRAIGLLGDDPARLRAALDYMERA